MLSKIELHPDYNYVGVFLTLGCGLACSYCLSGDTLILTPYGHKPIKDIEIGDEVIGFEEKTKRMKQHKLYITKVTQKFIREGVTQRIITKNSHLDITDEHPVLTERGWKPAKNVSKSNQIKFVYNPNLSNCQDKSEFKRGYLKGVFEGDGCFRIAYKFKKRNNPEHLINKQYDQYCASLRMWDEEPLDRTYEYIKDILHIEPLRREHRVSLSKKNEVIEFYEMIQYKKPIGICSFDYATGYLSGIFDAEGSFDGNSIRIHNMDRTVLNNIKESMYRVGLFCKEENYEKRNGVKSIRVSGGMSQNIKFFFLSKPSIKRKMDKLYPMAIPNSDQVIGREEARIQQTVYNIETESHTYVANGLCVHNCINIMEYKRSDLFHKRKAMTAKDWIDGLNRIDAREDLPITLQGGEPTGHKEFYEIINNVHKPIDLLTNAQFNIDEFMRNIHPEKFKRSAPYASIRVSFHPEQMELKDTVSRVSTLRNNGYQVGVWMVEVPDQMHVFSEAKTQFQHAGIDFRGKELLGEYNGKVYGHLKYENSVGQKKEDFKSCLCRTTELLIAPDGSIHRCHSDVYNLREGIGHLMDDGFRLDRKFRTCQVFGDCSACDVKRTFNRFQVSNWTSVEIKNIGEPVEAS